MIRSARYLLSVLALLISLHYIISFTHEDYQQATSLSNIKSKFQSPSVTSPPEVVDFPVPPNDESQSEPKFDDVEWHTGGVKRANATFVVLCRNSDLDGALRSVRQMEDRFNRRYAYPYVFLNEEPFTDEFKRRLSVLSSAPMEFGVIPSDHWYQPSWINETLATANREKMVEDKIIYGGSVSYRNMCRFNSGFFYRHPLVQKYRWYWRIEPNVHYHCDLQYDPFVFMEENNKVYAFTITMYEYRATIPTLWDHVMDFAKSHPEFIAKDNSLGFMTEDNGRTYNLCHFWSNFEIGDLDFWRGPAYTAFFEYLDNLGGFYYERWGDAPVHSIAAALFASKNQIQFFDDIGYEHNPYVHCPKDNDVWTKGKCGCDQACSFDYDGYSCMSKWDKFIAG